MVVAVEPLAAAVGAAVLEQGGNAVDAAIATTFALCVTHPSAASLGGGGFALVRGPNTPTRAFDFREVAPRSLTRPRFDAMIAAGARGPAAVGVPGTIAGLASLHSQFATKPLHELIAPAIALARQGHALRPWQARVLGWSYPVLARDASARAVFGPRGVALRAGARLTQPGLARTLQRIAENGPDEFYRGALAGELAAALAPGGPDVDDLAAYRAVERTPLAFRYRGYIVETMPPPSAGGVSLAGILLTLQHAAPPSSLPGGEDAVHWFLEASRRAQAERRFGVVDPDVLSDATRAAQRSRWMDPSFWLKVPVDPNRATPSSQVHPLFPKGLPESENTTHISVNDAHGQVVSLTTTLSASFGAKIVAGSTGIVMNNAVASFSFAGDNQPHPTRRTTSSMAPTLLRRGEEVVAVLGTPGGDTIPSTLAQIVRSLIDHGQSIENAIKARRWHHGFIPDEARYEPSPPPDPALLSRLAARGHQLRPLRRAVGGANCIVLRDSFAYGFADPREHGATAIPRAQ